ncbi:MAG: hypothetical protein BWK80_23190 [Desulfobacteraceae bacterium IS3]|nr:MAG: hypothetical protein BWK80_23190 [Desulfobacteraceae bacterium IS3]HAO20676.1 hypothetical protein [Desulfobacteraceae bacterium]
METAYADVISKPIYQILTYMTHTSGMEIALPLAVKELVSLKLKETAGEIKLFEQRYGTDFEAFKSAWHQKKIPNQHSYDIEKDYWEWEAAVSDYERLCQMRENLL